MCEGQPEALASVGVGGVIQTRHHVGSGANRNAPIGGRVSYACFVCAVDYEPRNFHAANPRAR